MRPLRLGFGSFEPMIDAAELPAAPPRPRPLHRMDALLASARWPSTGPSWWLALAAACFASTLAALSSGAPVTIGILLGLAASVAVALLPFRWIVIGAILASGFTRVDLAVAGFNLRPDIVLVPAGLISCGVRGGLPDLVRWLRQPVIVLLGLFVALQFPVSALASRDPAKSLSVATWLGLNLAIVVLTLTCFGDDRRVLLRWLAVTAFVVVGSGFVGWLLATVFAIPGGVVSDSSGVRALGIAFEPNILAGTAAMWGVILLTSARKLRARDYVFLLLCFLTIPLSDTRAAAIALAAGIAVYVMLRPRRASRLAVVGLVALVAFIAVEAAAQTQSQSLSQKLLNYGDPTASARMDSVTLAVGDLSGPSWLFGLGTNSFGQRHLEPTLLPAQVPAYLGNLPLQALYDSGLIGLALLAAAAWLLVWAGDRPRRSALMVTFLAIASATSPFFFANWWLLIAAALARDGGSVASATQRNGALAGVAATTRRPRLSRSYSDGGAARSVA